MTWCVQDSVKTDNNGILCNTLSILTGVWLGYAMVGTQSKW